MMYSVILATTTRYDLDLQAIITKNSNVIHVQLSLARQVPVSSLGEKVLIFNIDIL